MPTGAGFDAVVVGKGLIGSAAARHLADQGLKVCIVGPDEPKDPATAEVFASHYDEARVVRQIGADPVWTELGIRSVGAFGSLERESGVRFHRQDGCLTVLSRDDDPYLENGPVWARAHEIPHRVLPDARAIESAAPIFHFPRVAGAILEGAPAGSLDPHGLIEAQLRLAARRGTTVVRAVVKSVEPHGTRYEVATADQVFRTRHVLVTAGAFTNFHGLIPAPLRLELKAETVLLAELAPEVAARLATLPSLLWSVETQAYEGVYLTCPIAYPDGSWCLKLGCNFPDDERFTDIADIRRWFTSGDSERHRPRLEAILQALMPTLPVVRTRTRRRVITRTPSGRPMIGPLGPGLVVATGGNGYSAMCSDALGAIAAHVVVEGVMPEPFDRKDFRVEKA